MKKKAKPALDETCQVNNKDGGSENFQAWTMEKKGSLML